MPKKLKPPFTCTAAESAFALLSFPLGFLYIRWALFWSGAMGISIFAFTAVFCLYLTLFFQKNRGALTPTGRRLLLLTLALGAYFAVSDNHFLNSWAFLLLTALAIWDVLAISGLCYADSGPLYRIAEGIHGIIVLPFGNFFLNFRSIFFSARKSKEGRKAGLALIGFVIALLLLAAVLPLLESDPAFSALWRYLSQYWSVSSFWLRMQLILSLPVACYLYGLIGGGNRRQNPGLDKAKIDRAATAARVAPPILTCAVLIPLLLVYLLFFMSQLGYFLSAFQSVLPENFTYAEYARQGFFELLRICCINLLVLLGVDLFAKEQPVAVRFCRKALAAFTLLFVVSAMSKMVLYTGIYGLTPKRVYASWVMILLFAVFLLLGGFIPARDHWKRIYQTAAIAFALLLFLHPSGLIARYNTSAYLDERLPSVDFSLLDRSGDSAIPSLVRLAEQADDQDTRSEAHQHLRSAYRRHEFIREQMLSSSAGEGGYSWGSWTLSFAWSDHILAQYADSLPKSEAAAFHAPESLKDGDAPATA